MQCAIIAHVETLSLQELGRRISHARERASLTQDQLADQINLDRTALSKIERGTRKVSAIELLELSRTLNISMDSLFREPIPAIVSHRSSLGMSTQGSAIDRVLESIATDVEFVDSEVRFLSTPVEHFDIPSTASDAEDMAVQARQLMGVNLTEPLIEIAEVLGQIGLLVFAKPIGADCADGGLILLQRGGVCFVNSSMKSGRRRLAAAHELGHFLCADDYVVDHKVTGETEIKTEAMLNRFARAFLLPPEAAKKWQDISSERDARTASIIVGSQYRVDMATLAHRLRDLELISFPEMNDIREYRTTKSDIVEFGLVNREELAETYLPRPFQLAILDMYRKERLTDYRALQLLQETFSPDDLPVRPAHSKEEVWGLV